MNNVLVSMTDTPRPKLMRPVAQRQSLTLDDQAVDALTDFTREHPLTIDEHRPIDVALEDMIRFGVRALMVMQEHRVVGLITSYDIQGERPMQLLQRSIYSKHDEIRVRDIMTVWEDLPILERRSVLHANIAELLDMFHGTRLMYLVVIEQDASGTLCVCGLISRTQLERQLKHPR